MRPKIEKIFAPCRLRAIFDKAMSGQGKFILMGGKKIRGAGKNLREGVGIFRGSGNNFLSQAK
jgi:hypothetical protein